MFQLANQYGWPTLPASRKLTTRANEAGVVTLAASASLRRATPMLLL